MAHICVGDLSHHWFRDNRFSPLWQQNDTLKQCLLIIDWQFECQWNAHEISCKRVVILSRPQISTLWWDKSWTVCHFMDIKRYFLRYVLLKHSDPNKRAMIMQITFSNAFLVGNCILILSPINRESGINKIPPTLTYYVKEHLKMNAYMRQKFAWSSKMNNTSHAASIT